MRKFILISATIISALLGALFFASPSKPGCTGAFNGVQYSVCTVDAGTPPVTWRSWVQGKSRSTQFHFLDLVELIFGEKVNDMTKKKAQSEKKSQFFQ